jgi:hypothetical protein
MQSLSREWATVNAFYLFRCPVVARQVYSIRRFWQSFYREAILPRAARTLMRRLLAINLLLLGSIPALAQHPTGGGAAPLGLLVFLALAIFAIWILIRILKKLGSLIGSKPQRHREPQVKKELRHPGPTRPGKLIFISYRREDSSHITGRIYDELCAKFGEGSVFKDVNKILLASISKNTFRTRLRAGVPF